MRKLIVSGAIRLSVYALTLIGAMAGSVIGAFEILPEGRALRIVLLVVACLCVVCNIWLKWQDTIEAERKEETIEDLRGKLDSQSKMMNTLMANSEPSAPTLRLVQKRFAKLLTSRGWHEFAVMDFESPKDNLTAFVCKGKGGRGERIMWLHAHEINLLSTICNDVEFENVAMDILDKAALPANGTVVEDWNLIPDVVMPVMLIAYDVSGARLDAQGNRIYFPMPTLDVEKHQDDPNIEFADYRGKSCAWVCFESQFLSSLFGCSRVELSQKVVAKISEFGM